MVSQFFSHPAPTLSTCVSIYVLLARLRLANKLTPQGERPLIDYFGVKLPVVAGEEKKGTVGGKEGVG
jgi:hypothetical protein